MNERKWQRLFSFFFLIGSGVPVQVFQQCTDVAKNSVKIKIGNNTIQFNAVINRTVIINTNFKRPE